VPGEQTTAKSFVTRLHARIEQFGKTSGIAHPVVEVELQDQARFRVESIFPEPGNGFVTFAVHPEEDLPKEIIVPLSAIARIELFDRDEPERGFGFTGS
jgi:hypothetical protein